MKLRVLGALSAFALFAMTPAPTASTLLEDDGIFPPGSKVFGKTYGQWSASWWTWFMEHPVAGHPSTDDFSDVTSGQSGKVWFLAAPIDFGAAVPRTRNVTIPKSKALFVGIVNAEFSSQEGFPTEEEQRATANFFADHIVDVTFTLDGEPVDDIDEFRFESPQFTFTAPDPWIFGPAGAGDSGTSVADGYYVFVEPLSVGQHVLHYTGGFHFDAGELGPDPVDLALDMTYNVTVQ